jgi:hypothetical protein
MAAKRNGPCNPLQFGCRCEYPLLFPFACRYRSRSIFFVITTPPACSR